MRLIRNQRVTLLVFLFLALALPLFLVSQQEEIKATGGSTLTVCPTSGAGCDYVGGDGIQQAVDAAEAGSSTNKTRILIEAGNYTRENYTEYIDSNNRKRKCFVNTKEKFLIFEGEGEVILDGEHSANMSGFCAKGGEIEVKNLKIVGFKKDPDECFTNDTTQACSRGSGIVLELTAKATIQNNQISGNQVSGGIILVNSSQAKIINNTLYKNKVAGINIYQCGDSNPSVEARNNIITHTEKNTDGTFGFGIGGSCLHDSGKLGNDTFAYNLIWGNEGDNTKCGTNELCEFTGRVNADPKFVNPEGGDFHLQAGSPAIDSGDPDIKDPDGSRSDMGVYGGPGACGSDPNLPGCISAPTSIPKVSNTPTPTPTPTPLPQFGSCGSCSADQWGGCTPKNECRLINDINICQANNKPGTPCCLRDQSCSSSYQYSCGYGDPQIYCHKCQRFQNSAPWCTSFRTDCGAGKPAKPRLKSPAEGLKIAEDNPLTLMWYAYGEKLPEKCGELLEDKWGKWEDCRGVVHWGTQAQCIPEVGSGENAGDRSCWGYVCARGQLGIPSQWRFYQVLVKKPGEDTFLEICNIEDIPNPSVVGGTISSQKVSCNFTPQNSGFYSWRVRAGYVAPLEEGNVFINSNESEPFSFLFCPLGDKGNLNCDNQRSINEADLSLILSTWGNVPDWSGEVRWSPDLNGDNKVDEGDLQLLIENWREQ